MKIKIILTIALLVIANSTDAKKHKKHERDYQREWCKGKMEYVLPDRTRVDCLTDSHAIEFDFGKKWHEAIGQSLYYSLSTGRRAGVVLILRDKKDYRFWIRLNTTINHFKLPIDALKIEAWRTQNEQRR